MWIANLSNGRTVTEDDILPGERTTWHNLIDFCRVHDIRITQVCISNNGAMVFGLKDAEGYMQAREIHKSVFSGAQHELQGVGSVVGNQVFISWLEDNGRVYQDIRPLSSVRMHTTLR